MKTIWDYKVSYKYGANVPGYDGFHYGEDRTAPSGTPVTVNGVVIGKVGTTGKSTGPHLHIGKWASGKSHDPKGGGKSLPKAIVTEIDKTGYTNNGKFVRVQSGSYSWVYLHLSAVNVRVGQTLEDDMYKGKSAKYWYEQYAHKDKVAKTWAGRYQSLYQKVKASLGRYFDK